MVEVSGTTTCKKCGSQQVAWVQGQKSGKWYLAEAYMNSATGHVEAARFDFHSVHCNPQVQVQTPMTATVSLAAMKERFAEVPAGRYAFVQPGTEEFDGEDSGHDFYQVRRPTKGNWTGYVFVDRLIGSPGDYRKVPVKGHAAFEVLVAVEADPLGAMTLFGLVSGQCGRCGAELTDPESLARGIGPDCWQTMHPAMAG